MILKDWLKRESLPPYQFARMAGLAPATIYKSIAGTQRLSARLAVQIEEMTDGQVSRTEAVWPEDFIEIDKHGNEQLLLAPRMKKSV